MTSRWDAWSRLLPIWLPAVLLSLASILIYLWQSSETVGTEARLRNQIAELEAGVEMLHRISSSAAEQGTAVRAVNEQLTTLSNEGFGSLDERLTDILRGVGDATRGAGLRPSTFSYSTRQESRESFTKFTIRFNVIGQYAQVRQMLATVQSSPEFLMVTRLGLAGEEQAMSRDLSVSIELATYLSSVDEALLKRLQRGLIPAGGELG
jgi:Tfp pilus assembly protein PilO